MTGITWHCYWRVRFVYRLKMIHGKRGASARIWQYCSKRKTRWMSASFHSESPDSTRSVFRLASSSPGFSRWREKWEEREMFWIGWCWESIASHMCFQHPKYNHTEQKCTNNYVSPPGKCRRVANLGQRVASTVSTVSTTSWPIWTMAKRPCKNTDGRWRLRGRLLTKVCEI